MPANVPADDQPAWYVVHAKPKCEHLAAGIAAELPEVATWCPRIRFQRNTRRGKVWFIEALFPGYFFAHFAPSQALRAVKHSQSVIRVVEFGGHLARVPDEFIAQLRAEMQNEDIRQVDVPVRLGDEVEVTTGPMRGLRGIVTSLTNAKDRVRILLEFLGRENLVDVDTANILTDQTPRSILARGA